MFDESLLSERNLREQLDLELLAGPLAQFGPTERERAIFAAIYGHQQSEHTTARQFEIAPRTMRNIARAMQRRLAELTHAWDQLSLAELIAERVRVDGVQRLAMQAFEDTQQETPRFKHRRSPWLYLEIASRLRSTKRRLDAEIRRRRPLEAPRPLPVAAETTRVPSEPTPATFAPVAAEPEVRRSRTGRRKILRGRRLRLPGFVGRRPVCRSAAAVRAVIELVLGVWRTGIPPPRASRAPDRLTRSHRRRAPCAHSDPAPSHSPSPLAPG